MKAMEVIKIGRSRRRLASTAAWESGKTFLVLFVAGKFDNENGVFAGEAHQHNQADLRKRYYCRRL